MPGAALGHFGAGFQVEVDRAIAGVDLFFLGSTARHGTIHPAETRIARCGSGIATVVAGQLKGIDRLGGRSGRAVAGAVGRDEEDAVRRVKPVIVAQVVLEGRRADGVLAAEGTDSAVGEIEAGGNACARGGIDISVPPFQQVGPVDQVIVAAVVACIDAALPRAAGTAVGEELHATALGASDLHVPGGTRAAGHFGRSGEVVADRGAGSRLDHGPGGLGRELVARGGIGGARRRATGRRSSRRARRRAGGGSGACSGTAGGRGGSIVTPAAAARQQQCQHAAAQCPFARLLDCLFQDVTSCRAGGRITPCARKLERTGLERRNGVNPSGTKPDHAPQRISAP